MALPVPPAPSSRRRALVLGGLWLVIGSAALFSPGCYGRNCEDGPGRVYGTIPGQGRMVDDTRWESNAPGDKWLPFPRQRYYIFDIKTLGGRTPDLILPYLSATENGQLNFAVGGGNLTTLSNALPNRIDVRNDSCSDYFLRLVVVVPPLPPPAGDGGPETLADATVNTPADAGDAGDAGDDAGDAGL